MLLVIMCNNGHLMGVNLLSYYARSVIVWKGANLLVYGDVLCTLLFGDQLRSDLIDCYMRILYSPSYREKYGHGVWSMDTVVMV